MVSESLDGERLLLGEAKYARKPFTRHDLERSARRLAEREPPALAKKYREREPWRVLFVPATEDGEEWREFEGVLVVTAAGLLGWGAAG